jgi:hypothetical protein
MEVKVKVAWTRIKRGFSNKVRTRLSISLSRSDLEGFDEVGIDVKKSVAKKLADKLAFSLGYELTPKKVKVCPECGSHKVAMFDSDNDRCSDCGKLFPAVGYTDLSKEV